MAIEVIRRMMPLVLVALPTVASACPLGGGRPMFQFENDMRGMTGKDSDDAYTAGARLGMKDRAVEADKGPISFLAWPVNRNDSCVTWSAGLALNMYTPSFIETTAAQPNDRPYGAWLYGTSRFAAYRIEEDANGQQDVRSAQAIEYDVGILGPGAAGRWFQDTIHRIFGVQSRVGPGIKHPLGWHHQLRNEPGLNVIYLRSQRLLGPPALASSRRFDAVWQSGGALGTIFTWASVGGMARAGNFVPNDLGPSHGQASILPADLPIPDSDPMKAQVSLKPPGQPALSYYFFVGVEGRSVLRNAFLDGNLLVADRPDAGRVDKKAFVADLDVGGSVALSGWFRVTYHVIRRSSEFRTVAVGLPDARPQRYALVTVEAIHSFRRASGSKRR
ncbi:MAG TPA: lipid A deacylase LpxR family protein [Vicinamibacterales bacterium]|nr:lipid A deacylase LpxR family protein [Vicinamibacterales bacterium]